MLKVALIDKSLRMQEALRMLLSTVGGLEIVGSAVDAVGAKQLRDEVEPDVFVIDAGLPCGPQGLDLLGQLTRGDRPPDVVVMTDPVSRHRRDDLLAAGAQACFDKAGDGLQLVRWMRGRVAVPRRVPASTRQPLDGMLSLRD